MEIKFTTEFVPVPENTQAQTLPRINRELGNGVAPYRDDAARLRAFTQHISIARDIAEELVSLRARFERAIGSGGSAEAASTAAQEIGGKCLGDHPKPATDDRLKTGH